MSIDELRASVLYRERRRGLLIEGAWYLGINVVTIGLFLGYSFGWEGTEGMMRFMW